MSIAMLERAAGDLEPFLDELAFVGGATIALWITDSGAPEPRATRDVDAVVEVASRLAWYRFEDRLRRHGLRNDTSSSVICRWRAGSGEDEVLIDLLPGDAQILGFENRWQGPALSRARRLTLPSGQRIRAISPPYLLATKLEAWAGRGGGDHLRSHDLEDVIKVVDGRSEVVDEVRTASDDLRGFVSREIALLLEQPRFSDAVEGTVIGLGRRGSRDVGRVDEVLLPRFQALAEGDRQ